VEGENAALLEARSQDTFTDILCHRCIIQMQKVSIRIKDENSGLVAVVCLDVMNSCLGRLVSADGAEIIYLLHILVGLFKTGVTGITLD